MKILSETPPVFHLGGLTLAVLALLSACGGSGSTSGAITLSGTAATGAPMTGATIVVKDNTGAEVQSCASDCVVDSNGEFSVPLKATAKPPFVLLVKQEGSDEPQVSMIDTSQSTTVNVSPITTLIAARLSPNGDPAQLTGADLTAGKIATATSEITTALKPLLEATGLAADANPVTMVFKADSTGLDKALDMMGKPTIVRDSGGKAKIEVALKSSGSDEALDAESSSAKISLVPGSAVNAPNLTKETIQQSALPADGINQHITSLIQRMQNCYALAPSERRSSGATLASEIIADTCKSIFIDDNPSKYLHNNTVVSQAGASLPSDMAGRFSGAFKGLFSNIQGMKFDLPEYRYTIKNTNTTDATKPMSGDVVFTARWTVTDLNAGESAGQSDVGEYHARIQNGSLKLIGNQSKHDLSINAQARREEMPAVSSYAYLSTGYNISIAERKWNHDGNSSTPNVSIYEQVVVTSPSGKTFTLKPHPSNNYDYLGLVKGGGTITSAATVRLNGAYIDSTTNGHPSERFTKEFWASSAEWTEDAIKAIPEQGNWKFEITLTDAFVNANANLGAVKNSVHFRRTINRSPTLEELKAITWPTLKDPASSGLKEEASSQGFVTISKGGVAESLEIDGWSVPNKAWAPTFVKVYGSTWDEGAVVASTARKVIIPCTSTGSHCEKASGTNKNTGKFINAGFGYLQLTGRDSRRLQMSLNYSTRQSSSDSSN